MKTRPGLLLVCSLSLLFDVRHAAAQIGTLLPKFLEGVAAEARLATPLRAEGKAEIDNLQGKKEDRIVLVHRGAREKPAETQVFAEFEKAKVKVLSLGAGDLMVASGGSAKKAESDATVAGTSWTAEDFLEFSPARCAAMRIADVVEESLTVLCEPKREISQYSLIVTRFDREKFVPQQVLLYKETQSNLVKMVKYDDFAAVGKKWRPTRMVMQDFKLRTKDVFRLTWADATDLRPELFDPKRFSAATALR